jgi:lambda repressor-like predicted transcriptional regulator
LDEARFRALLEARGWSVSELARRWGITPARLRQVIQEGHDRAAHWNDAVRGLPQARWVTRTQERSDRRLELELEPYLKASSRGGARTTVAGAVGNLRARATPSDRSHETALGAVWRVNSEQGDHLPHGCAGTVLASRIKSPAAVGVAASREICLGFETGYVEWMEVKWLNAPNFWLTYVGETVDDVANGLYQFSTVEQAEQDLLGRKLRFA